MNRAAAQGLTRDAVQKGLDREAKTAKHRAAVLAGEAYRHETEEQRDFVYRARRAGWKTSIAVNGTRMAALSQRDRSVSWSNQVSMGATKGANDVDLVHPLMKLAARCEMKRVKEAYGPIRADGGGAWEKEVSDEQHEWLDALKAAGQWCFVGWGAEDAWAKLKAGPT